MEMERVRPQAAANAHGRRMSIFTEVGLVDEERIREERSPIRTHGQSLRRLRPAKMLRFRSRNDVINETKEDDDESDWESVYDEDEESDTLSATTVMPTTYTMPMKLYRLGLFSIILAMLLPIIQLGPIARMGVRGGIIPRAMIQADAGHSLLVSREDSPTNTCKRWSGQTAVVNGTLYMYGFRTTTDAKQQSDTWSKSTYATLLLMFHTDFEQPMIS